MARQPKPIAAIYVRVSTTKASQKDSPEHQEGICREKARIMGLETPDDLIYEDRDSGTSIVERQAIRQLLEDAKAGRFQAVLFASLSRFSRDLVDSMALKRMLVDALKIRLISIDENYDSGVDQDEFKFQIFSAVNQKQSEMISLSSRRGIRQSALKGNFTGSIPPYGYRKAVIDGRKTLVPDEAESAVVREIFRLYTANRLGDKAIAIVLNERGIPSPKGGAWGVTTIQRILQNEAYTGVNVFGKYETVKVHSLTDLHDRRKKLVQRDKSEWERSVIGRTHEPIIDQEMFRAAQEIRLQRGGGRRGGVRNRKNVFAGLIFCGLCGASMVSLKSKEYRYLVCSRRRRQGDAGCRNEYRLPYEPFRDALLADLADKMSAVAPAEEWFEKHCGLIRDDPPEHEREIAELDARIRRCREAIYTLRKDWVDGRLDREQMEFEKSRFEQELRLLEERLAEKKANAPRRGDMDGVHRNVRDALEDLLELNFDDEEEFDELHLILRKLIEAIAVARNGVVMVRTSFREAARPDDRTPTSPDRRAEAAVRA
jgi:Site-specific recombinases, DNA invertase Pin homologs